MIGILYESREWSDFKLKDELESAGLETRMIDMTNESYANELLTCELLVSRVFASAQFRGNQSALIHMESAIKIATSHSIPLLNSAAAHQYEINKSLAAEQLSATGIDTPRLYALGLPDNIDVGTLAYPCVIKPNCGGRSTNTAIVHSVHDAQQFLSDMPAIPFLVEEYLCSELGYIVRAEVIGRGEPLVFKRSIGADGLSSYHHGSHYDRYDNPQKHLIDEILHAADMLEFELGSFDIIEAKGKAYFIDANSVTNVSEDCFELLGIDLMSLHASYIADRYSSLS